MTTKPDWKDAPKWAKYLVYQFYANEWEWYERRPEWDDINWMWYSDGRSQSHHVYFSSESLEERPSE